ncbi:MAG: hypothetical protein ACLU38_02315 [Dysosmobacter sp.]
MVRGLLRHHPGGGGDRGHGEHLQGHHQRVHHLRGGHRPGAGQQESTSCPPARSRSSPPRSRCWAAAAQRAALPRSTRSREADEAARLKYRYPGSAQPRGEEQHRPALPGGGRPAAGR